MQRGVDSVLCELAVWVLYLPFLVVLNRTSEQYSRGPYTAKRVTLIQARSFSSPLYKAESSQLVFPGVC